MNSVIGALRVNLGIDTAAFSDGLKKAQSSLGAFGKKMQSFGASMTTYVTAPITAAAGTIATAMSMMASNVDELRKSAAVAGAGFEEFQRLAFAARSVSIESEKLADVYKAVNDKVGEFLATGGGEMKDFFDTIAPKVGVTAEAFRNLSGPQALQLYYDSLVKAGASQKEITFYLEAIADEATALAPLLRDGGRAFAELGAGANVISEDDAAGLKAYNDAMRQLGEAVKGLTVAIASSGLIEWATQMVIKITEWVKYLAETNPEIIKWGAVVAGLVAVIGPLAVTLGVVASAIAAIGAPVAIAIAGIAALTAALVAFWPEIVNLSNQITAFLTGAWASFEAAWDSIVAKVAAFEAEVVRVATNAVFAVQNMVLQITDWLTTKLSAAWDSVIGKVKTVGGWFEWLYDKTVGHSWIPDMVVEIGQWMAQLGDRMVAPAQAAAQQTGEAFAGIGSSFENVFSSFGSSIGEAIKGTKKWTDVLKDLLSQIAKVALSGLAKSFGGAGGFGGFLASLLGGLIGFADGGSFNVGGAGGIDSQIVAFRASPNETVNVSKPGQGGGGAVYAPVYNIDARGADQAAIERLERGLAERDRKFGKMVDARIAAGQTRKTRA